MPDVSILIPTIGRADRLPAIVDNIHEATQNADHEIVFIAEDDDDATHEAARRLMNVDSKVHLLTNERARNYAGAINTGYRHTDAPLLFAGADDLHFHERWFERARRHIDEWVMVVGTNDLLNPYVGAGAHATHYLVDRRYLDLIGGVVDEGPGSFLCEAYSHQYTDTEFIGTAKMRARFRPCLDSIVEHRNAWAPGGVVDATARKGMAGINEDSKLYDQRRDLWFAISR